jgi:uncharacterized phage protein (TIGR01671 family)
MENSNNRYKFRAWVKKEEEMVDVTTIEFTPDEENPQGWIACPWEQGFNESIDTQEKDCVFKMEDVELMQFTGLHDKNGKEVFEGDIVKSGTEFDDYTGLDCDLYGGNIYEVKNNGWRFYLEPKSIYEVNLKNVEVIGNIYENPELLNN